MKIIDTYNLLNEKSDVPLSLFIIGFIVFFIGLAGQLGFQVCNHVWDERPPVWDSVYKFVTSEKGHLNIAYPDNSSRNDSILETEIKNKNFKNWPELLKNKGAKQAAYWAKRLLRTEIEIEKSKNRITIFFNCLDDSSSKNFLLAREKLNEERDILSVLMAQKKKMEIATGNLDFIKSSMLFFFSMLVFVLFSYFIRLLLNIGSLKKIAFSEYKTSWILLSLLLFLSNIAIASVTSILDEEKNWIGASSFFVAWQVWIFERITVGGVQMICSIPVVLLWNYLKDKRIPEITKEWLYKPGFHHEISDYVSFLQKTTFILFIELSFVSIVFLKWANSQQLDFEKAYLLIPLINFIIIAVLICKMILNALILRRKYHQAVLRSFYSLKEYKNASILPDPTIEFIGENWWKLPLNFLGIITSFWALFDWFGTAHIIMDALK